jgi:electron transfer flavoprotein alpha subunit
MLKASLPNPSRHGSVVELKPDISKAMARVVGETFEADKDAVRLDNAEVIVSAGYGIGGRDKMKTISELAEILDAPIATTRKVVDMGWLPRQLQVGLTGRSIAPKLYLAIGIRGAFNHMVGIGRARTIVAINNDSNAPIFKNCDYGIVGDYEEVVPILTDELRQRKSAT